MTEILTFTDVTAGYGPTHVLRGVSLSIHKGERLAIIGRNGAGKTTLMATMMGLTRMHGGQITLNGQRIDRLPPFKRNALGLGLVPQTRDIFKSLSVEENLLAANGTMALEEAYALFPRLKERRRNGGGQLSGGEQQMLAIARTLMTEPQVILLDEPLEGLAPVICEHLMDVFDKLAQSGRTLLLVEQHAEAALSFASRAVLMSNGAIVHDGPSDELKQAPDLLHRHVGLALTSEEDT
ncbi:ABC transporter ATP-binding protein [Pseudoprimorskyibacter insulae]|uniref:High-affinity branched-chain amino acid transport ATP-binding protein LivF n=1 Tax=Pseudoprimorskyibacter insulae TaxID=1695997 RepID=A0A2R8AY61_9RHOB|nr:ABC transporter ATP-binding protein [Pseudoprimorskyibacter insulae]SPF80940.1 High-affinity branched-chain amino acid transport ATP-binding protein LivF [Pseudoprimorskyibacter insulae]